MQLTQPRKGRMGHMHRTDIVAAEAVVDSVEEAH